MLFVVSVDYTAIIVATIVGTIVGMLWYGPLFGKKWMDYMARIGKPVSGKFDADAKKAMGLGLIVTLVMSYVLYLFVAVLSVDSIGKAVELGIIVWLGFTATVMANSILYEDKDKGITVIGALYYLVSFVLMTIAIVLML
ncbi:hypothetical protein CL654_01140 [bacterium]|nr:hypothetical protein [bacterium]|tara:strand:+ start:15205 stop:15624 length:420 start_codon:yes stop_codon:yes gene_type:complete